MKEAGKAEKLVEENCSMEDLDKEGYEKAREKAANILLNEKSEISEQKMAALGKKKKKKFEKST